MTEHTAAVERGRRRPRPAHRRAGRRWRRRRGRRRARRGARRRRSRCTRPAGSRWPAPPPRRDWARGGRRGGGVRARVVRQRRPLRRGRPGRRRARRDPGPRHRRPRARPARATHPRARRARHRAGDAVRPDRRRDRGPARRRAAGRPARRRGPRRSRRCASAPAGGTPRSTPPLAIAVATVDGAASGSPAGAGAVAARRRPARAGRRAPRPAGAARARGATRSPSVAQLADAVAGGRRSGDRRGRASADPDRSPAAYAEARRCLDTLRTLGRDGEVSDPAGLGLARLLLGRERARASSRRVRRARPSARCSTTTPHAAPACSSTLEAWFAAGGRLEETAAALHVHPNTVSPAPGPGRRAARRRTGASPAGRSTCSSPCGVHRLRS